MSDDESDISEENEEEEEDREEMHHRWIVSHLSKDPGGQPYIVLCRRHRFNAWSERIEVEGVQKHVFHPVVDHIEVIITDSKQVWHDHLHYERFNFSRKKAGGRDDTWTKDEYDDFLQDIIQNYREMKYDSTYTFTQEDDGKLTLEIKGLADQEIPVSFLKKCKIEQATDMTVEEAVEQATVLLSDTLGCAVRVGDMAKAKEMVSLNADPHRACANMEGWTPLQLACHFGQFEAAHWLVTQEYVDVNFVSLDGWYALMCAARNGHDKIVDFLLDHDSIYDKPLPDNRSPVSMARTFGHTAVVLLLVGPDGPITEDMARAMGVRDKTPLSQMFQLGKYDKEKVQAVRFPPGHDRWPHKTDFSQQYANMY
jgi:hypothetical protein